MGECFAGAFGKYDFEDNYVLSLFSGWTNIERVRLGIIILKTVTGFSRFFKKGKCIRGRVGNVISKTILSCKYDSEWTHRQRGRL